MTIAEHIEGIADLSVRPEVEGFFDPDTATISYVVKDPDSDHCAIIDPVLGYDAASGRTDTAPADRLVAHVRERGLSTIRRPCRGARRNSTICSRMERNTASAACAPWRCTRRVIRRPA